jgi:hypothetical protein
MRLPRTAILLVFMAAVGCRPTAASVSETKLRKHLFADYDTMSLPVANAHNAVHLELLVYLAAFEYVRFEPHLPSLTSVINTECPA